MIQLSGHHSTSQICITTLSRHQAFIIEKKWKIKKAYKPELVKSQVHASIDNPAKSLIKKIYYKSTN